MIFLSFLQKSQFKGLLKYKFLCIILMEAENNEFRIKKACGIFLYKFMDIKNSILFLEY